MAPKVRDPLQFEAVLAETIKKEQRCFKIYQDYALTPKALKDIIFTTNPNQTSPTPDESIMDKSHLTNIERKQLHPKSLFEFPTTSAMDYGWDTEPLMRITDPRFHHPRMQTEITKLFGMASENKK